VGLKAIISLLDPLEARETWVNLTFKNKVAVELLINASISPYVSGMAAAAVINNASTNNKYLNL
jgi:hypothetical protein